MLAKVKALIRGIDNDGVIGQALILEIFQDAADAFIDGFNAGQIVVEVTIVFPQNQVFTREIGVAKGFVAGFLIGIPFLELVRS